MALPTGGMEPKHIEEVTGKAPVAQPPQETKASWIGRIWGLLRSTAHNVTYVFTSTSKEPSSRDRDILGEKKVSIQNKGSFPTGIGGDTLFTDEDWDMYLESQKKTSQQESPRTDTGSSASSTIDVSDSEITEHEPVVADKEIVRQFEERLKGLESLQQTIQSKQSEIDSLKAEVARLREEAKFPKDADKGLMSRNLSLERQQRELREQAEAAGLAIGFSAPQYEFAADDLINASIESMFEPFMRDGKPISMSELVDTEKNMLTKDLQAAEKSLQGLQEQLPKAKAALAAATDAEPARQKRLETLSGLARQKEELTNPVAEASGNIRSLESQIASMQEKVAALKLSVSEATDKVILNQKGSEFIKLCQALGVIHYHIISATYHKGPDPAMATKADDAAKAKFAEGIKKFITNEKGLIRQPGIDLSRKVDFTTNDGERLLQNFFGTQPMDGAKRKQHGMPNLTEGLKEGVERLRHLLANYCQQLPESMMITPEKQQLAEKYPAKTLPQLQGTRAYMHQQIASFNESAQEIADIYSALKGAGNIGDHTYTEALGKLMAKVDGLVAKGSMPQEKIDTCKKDLSRLYLDALLAENRDLPEIQLALDRCRTVDANIDNFESQLAYRGIALREAPPPPPPQPQQGPVVTQPWRVRGKK